MVLATFTALSEFAFAQDAGFEPIPAEVSAFLQKLFGDVPAPSIAATIPQTTCRKDLAEEPFDGVAGAKVIGAYFCKIDFGCGELGGAPVWFDANDTLWFGPDSADRLVATYCAESISDPGRRRTLSESVFQGG